MFFPNTLRTIGGGSRRTVGTESRKSAQAASASPCPPDDGAANALRRAADDAVEQLIESDPSLVPTCPSAFLVAPLVLERAEVEALLDGLSPLLEIGGETTDG